MQPLPPVSSYSYKPKQPTKNWSKSFWFKALIVFGLFCLLLIPTGQLRNLVNEREARAEEVKTTISDTWGHAQTIQGPILHVPVTLADSTTASWFVLPEQLKMNVHLEPETRKRGIYETQVYVAKVDCTGSFPEFDKMTIPGQIKEAHWDKTSVLIGLDDLRGVQTSPDLIMAGETYPANGSLGNQLLFKSGLQWQTCLDPNMDGDFSLQFDLRGSEDFQVVPAARSTEVHMTTPWKHPKFTGSFLPVNYSIDESGTEANWKVQEVNRALPDNWFGAQESLAGYGFGLSLFDPVDQYHKSERSVKYGFLFIALTFLVFGFTEVLIKKRIHPVQYLMAGLALVVFYLLLLAFSEFIGFNGAYAVASSAVVLLMIYFTIGVLKNKKAVLVLNGILISLYGFFFVIVSLQDHALLVGSIGTFLLLSLFMSLSRRMDWYKQMGEEDRPAMEQ